MEPAVLSLVVSRPVQIVVQLVVLALCLLWKLGAPLPLDLVDFTMILAFMTAIRALAAPP